jgi:hypothetical protein
MYQDFVWSKIDDIKADGKILNKTKFDQKWSKEVAEYLKEEIKLDAKELYEVLENTSYDDNQVFKDSIESWKYASQSGID